MTYCGEEGKYALILAIVTPYVNSQEEAFRELERRLKNSKRDKKQKTKDKIRRLRNQGYAAKEIARILNIKQNTIYKYISRGH